MKIILLLFLTSVIVFSNAQLLNLNIGNLYNSDYTVEEILRLLIRGFKVTTELYYDPDQIPVHEDVSFWCINRDTNLMKQVNVDENGSINDDDLNSKINLNKPVAFYIHGWLENRHRTWLNDTMNDHLKFFDTNVCVVDWDRLANFEYTICAMRNVFMVGEFFANFISSLRDDHQINLDNVTLIGHSLGGQISGEAGRRLEGSIGRIFGLDTAGIYFTQPEVVDISKRLDPTDAKYVQNVITTRGLMGVRIPCGHADFYINCGNIPQSKCVVPILQEGLFPEMLVCSHFFATEAFRYSLNSSNVFMGKQCPSDADLPEGCLRCITQTKDRLGVHTGEIQGKFNLYTNAKAPFARG